MSGPPAHHPIAPAPTVWLVVAIVLAAGLRFFALGANALWIDELATLQVAAHPLAQIPAVALHDDAFEPPLYFWLVHLVIRLFGESEAALRAPSAVAGVAAVPLIWSLLHAVGGSPRAAAIAAGLTAVHPLLLWYSQEARPYAVLVAFGLTSLLFLARALRDGGVQAWAGYAGFAALALLTHAVAVVFPATALLWVLLSDRPRTRLVPFAIASAGIIAMIAPFLLSLGHAVAGAEGTGSPPRPITGLEVPYTLLTFITGYSFGPAVREIQNFGWAAAIGAHPFQTAVALLTLALAMAVACRRPSRATLWLLGLLVVPVAATFAGSVVTTKAYNVRYTLPAAMGLIGSLGLGLAALRPMRRMSATALVIAVYLVADLQWFTTPRYWKEDSREAVACLDRALARGERVAIAPGYMASVARHYVARSGTPLTVVPVYDAEDLASAGPVSALLVTRLHHVPDAAGLTRQLVGDAGGGETSVDVPGYRVYFAGPGARDAAGRCRRQA